VFAALPGFALPGLALLGLTICAPLVGCRSVGMLPDLGGIYDRAAQHHDAERNPVVVIPGLLGSSLRDEATDTIVWGAFSGRFARPQTPEGARLFALPMRAGAKLAELTDDVRSDGALERIELRLFGLPVTLSAYRNILATLGVGGYRDESIGLSGAVDYGDEHFTCFQFDYDWRRDVPENARLLGEFLREKRAFVAERTGAVEEEVRFDIVAHSMGGLVLRWLLRYGEEVDPPSDGSVPWAGAPLVERAILIGTPNAGSLDALERLVNGYHPSFLTPRYPPAVLGTLPSAYQLLPRARHGALVGSAGESLGPDSPGPATRRLDPFDPELWIANGWGLADPGEAHVLSQLLPEVAEAEARREIALEHLRKCLARAAVVTRALDVSSMPPRGTQLHLVCGDARPTQSRIAVGVGGTGGRAGELSVDEWSPGDGTVLRSSALLDERLALGWTPRLVSPIEWASVMFLFSDHLGMTRDPVFVDNVLYLLLEAPRLRPRQ